MNVRPKPVIILIKNVVPLRVMKAGVSMEQLPAVTVAAERGCVVNLVINRQALAVKQLRLAPRAKRLIRTEQKAGTVIIRNIMNVQKVSLMLMAAIRELRYALKIQMTGGILSVISLTAICSMVFRMPTVPEIKSTLHGKEVRAFVQEEPT